MKLVRLMMRASPSLPQLAQSLSGASDIFWMAS
jgi:hypothetical protein